MKIFDCTTFFSEDMMMDLRFNVLNEHVHKFIVVESIFSHSGEKKKLNFDINKYPKFKDKIIYLVIENEPQNLIEAKSPAEKRSNSVKRINQSYEYMEIGTSEAAEEDLIILSDNDEIPDLKSEQFKDKIIYLVIDKEPQNLIRHDSNLKQHEKRINSLKRIDLSYDYMQKGIEQASEEDLIILSDNDEIPNLNAELFKKTNKNIIIFKQLFFYYKFNLLYDRMSWFGSKACKKKIS